MEEFTCLADNCQKTFKRKNMRTIHLRVYHSISHIINCHYCEEEFGLEREFIYEADLENHQKKEHPEVFTSEIEEKNRIKQIETARKTTSILKSSPKIQQPLKSQSSKSGSNSKKSSKKSPVIPLKSTGPKSNKSAEFVDSDPSLSGESENANRASDDFTSDSSINLDFSSSDSEEKLQQQFSGNKLVCRKCQILFQDRSKLKAHRRLMHKDVKIEKSGNLTRSKTTLHITSSEDSDDEGDSTEGIVKIVGCLFKMCTCLRTSVGILIWYL